MDKHEESRTWLKFFKDAGIPKKTGASYAHIFVENRITNDMLPELTVDYLRLMGITLMGDIIAILRHCKSVHQDSVRKVVILQSKDEAKKSSSISSSYDSSSADSSDDVEVIEVTKTSTKRIPTSLKSDDTIKMESLPVTENKQIKSQVGIVGKTNSSAPATVIESEKRTVQPVKRKFNDESENISQEDTASKTVISPNSGKSILKSATTPLVKKIRVTTENDVMGPKLPPPKKTVFERLGMEALPEFTAGVETESSQVSSTTEIPVVETKFTRIISSINIPLKSSEDTLVHKSSSVFNRLGGLKDSSQETKTVGPVLPYAGVLKPSPMLKRLIRPLNLDKKVRGTMRADEPEVPVKLRAATNVPTPNKFNIRIEENAVRSRLKSTLQMDKAGLLRKKAPSVESEGIFARESQSPSISVKRRLGLGSNSGEVSSTSNIKQRISWSPSAKEKILHNSRFEDDDDNEDGRFMSGSRVEIFGRKKVSFSNVDQKFIFPTLHSSSLSSSNTRSRDVHSRLGPTRYSL